MDALILPTTLQFSVPAIPKGMMEKAMWYIEHQDTHVQAVKLEHGTGYYVLAKNNDVQANKITKRLVEMYEAALDGKKDHRIKSLDELRAVCNSMHYVQPSVDDWHHCPCEGNPMCLVCDCKGCKGHGICSHVLAINHMNQQFNVRYQLAHIGKRAAKTSGGNRMRPEPALTRAPTHAPDSSDEEEEELLRLGSLGK